MMQDFFKKLHTKTGVRILTALLAVGLMAVLLAVVVSHTHEDGYVHLIGLSQPDLADNAQIALYNEVDAGCAREDMRLIAFDAGSRTAKQREDIQVLTDIGVDALIIVSENAEAMTDVINNAYEKGITVILIGSAPLGGKYTCNIDPNRYLAGKIAGEYVADLAGGKTCTVLEIQGEAKSRISRELQRGFLDVISGHENITKEYIMTGYWTQVDTRERMKEGHFFSREPAIDVIFAHNDAMAVAAAVTAEEKKSDALVLGVGGYGLPGSDLQAVKEGRLQAAVRCPTGGTEALQQAVKAIRDGEMPMEKVFLEPSLVTADNVDEYLAMEEAGHEE